jgi:Ceramidase
MWSTAIDLYCERTDPSLWAEPLNALTNAAFLIAATAAAVHWYHRELDLPALALIVITALIGLGSFTFHTVATRGAVYFDTIPITLFIYGYLLLAMRRLLRMGWIGTVIVLILFAGVSHGLAWVVPGGFLNGSYAYLPALTALLWVAYRIEDEERRSTIFLASGLFALSLAFRTIDLTICPVFPFGTHFIWHCLNAVVLYMLLKAAMKPRQRAAHMSPYSQAIPS